MKNVCEMCAMQDGALAACGKCEECGGATPRLTEVLCGDCAGKYNQCCRCRMDMNKSGDPQCFDMAHLKFDETCGACKTYMCLPKHVTHETLVFGAGLQRSCELVVHSWIMFSLLDTGSKSADWKVTKSSSAVRVDIDQKCIGIRARHIGSAKVVLTAVIDGKEHSFEFDIKVINPK